MTKSKISGKQSSIPNRLQSRRGLGKMALLKEFVTDKPHIYYLADLSTEKEQLKAFTEIDWHKPV